MKVFGVVSGFALAAVLAAGCGGGSNYARVSGVVTVDGKPYKNAVVAFQPVGGQGNTAPGRGSSAVTDENGRYTLTTDDGQTGAVVGKHKVRIQTKRDNPQAFFDPEVGSPDRPGAPGQEVGAGGPNPPGLVLRQGRQGFRGPGRRDRPGQLQHRHEMTRPPVSTSPGRRRCRNRTRS